MTKKDDKDLILKVKEALPKDVPPEVIDIFKKIINR